MEVKGGIEGELTRGREGQAEDGQGCNTSKECLSCNRTSRVVELRREITVPELPFARTMH